MKIPGYEFPKKGFLSLEKDYAIIIDKILKNEIIKKLLYIQDKNCLSMPNITEEQTLGLINKNILLVPKIKIDTTSAAYLYIEYDNFGPTNNPEFRSNLLNFYIICHEDYALLSNFQLRAYKIAGELEGLFSGKSLTGFGELEFVSAVNTTVQDFPCLVLTYATVHGNEDKVE